MASQCYKRHLHCEAISCHSLVTFLPYPRSCVSLATMLEVDVIFATYVKHILTQLDIYTFHFNHYEDIMVLIMTQRIYQCTVIPAIFKILKQWRMKEEQEIQYNMSKISLLLYDHRILYIN